jgi:hypothetical protein
MRWLTERRFNVDFSVNVDTVRKSIPTDDTDVGHLLDIVAQG